MIRSTLAISPSIVTNVVINYWSMKDIENAWLNITPVYLAISWLNGVKNIQTRTTNNEKPFVNIDNLNANQRYMAN